MPYTRCSACHLRLVLISLNRYQDSAGTGAGDFAAALTSQGYHRAHSSSKFAFGSEHGEVDYEMLFKHLIQYSDDKTMMIFIKDHSNLVGIDVPYRMHYEAI